MLTRPAAVLCSAAAAYGHATMYEPPTRNSRGISLLAPGCSGGSCLWFSQGCSIGCPNATGKGNVVGPADCKHPAEPTIAYKDKSLRTYNVGLPSVLGDWTKTHPWRKPGSAPVEDPCGLAGGWFTHGSPGNGGDAPPGAAQGRRGSTLPKLLKQTVWTAGSTAEVAWAIYANHGGGYQYRLCPASEPLTEACFQKLPLEPIGNTQWIQYGDGMDAANRTEIPATRVSEGTVPAGSTWTRNPIPACLVPVAGGAFNSPCPAYQFTPPLPGHGGFGGGACGSSLPGTKCTPKKMAEQSFGWGIVDKVKVPTVPAGDYVLGFRWDSEQTPQVWQSCGDVTIQESGEPSTPFTPMGGCDSCCPGGICANCTKCADDKTGDCAFCWKPVAGYNPSMVPQIQCLGYEGPDGGAPSWRPGDERAGGWSPGCARCWADEKMCAPGRRV